eukprot:14650728-Ditylum_brightwellii.AAC.1
MKKQSGVAISGMAKYVHTVLSALDTDVISLFQDEIPKHSGHWAKGCRTIVFSPAGLLAVLGILV